MAGLLLGGAVADVAFVGVEEEPAQGVELFAFIELATDTPAELLVDEPGEREVRLDQPPVFLQRPGERVPAAAGLQAGEQQRRRSPPVPRRCGDAARRSSSSQQGVMSSGRSLCLRSSSMSVDGDVLYR